MSTHEDQARDLLDAAARTQDVDVDGLWVRVRDDVRPRPDRERPGRAWLAVAATAAVTAGLAGTMVWTGGRQGTAPLMPAGGAEPTVTMNPTPTAPSTTRPTATPTSVRAEKPLPTIPGNVALPRNQRFANYSPTTSGWHIEGRVDGLAKVHIRGEAVNLVLAPGVMVNEGNRPAICEIYVPAAEAINLTGEELGRFESCASLPWPGSTRVRGLLSFSSPEGNKVDEWDGWVTMQVATASQVARVDYRTGGRTFSLQHRFSDPEWGGAYFMGFYPIEGDGHSPAQPGDGLVTYYDKNGRVLAKEQLR